VALILRLAAKEDDDADDDEEDEKSSKNPYADPSYPDLKFFDYSDPDYVVNQGIVGDELFPSEAEHAAVEQAAKEEEEGDVEAKIEEMRENRRKRNDEYQFETYHKSMWKGGDEYRGEWTVYRTSTFLGDGGSGDNDGEEEDAAAPPMGREEETRHRDRLGGVGGRGTGEHGAIDVAIDAVAVRCRRLRQTFLLLSRFNRLRIGIGEIQRRRRDLR